MTGILDGIKVIEVASFMAGPQAGSQLVDFGAEVIHVEPTGYGDPLRALYKMPPLMPSKVNYPWLLTNRSKKSIALNLKDPQAREVLYKLVEDADVFITNSLPRVAASLEVGYEKIKSINDKVIYALLTGFGEEGPEKDAPGFDETAWWARTGLMNTMRTKGTEPALAPTGVGDNSTSIGLFAAILLGLLHRERTGEGSKVSTSLMACGIWSNSAQAQAALVGCDPFEIAPHEETANPLAGGIYKTKDGQRIFLLQMNPKNWEPMCDALGCSDLKGDERFNTPKGRIVNAKELLAALDEIFGNLSLEEAVTKLRSARTNFSVVQANEDLPHDEQMIANGFFPEIEGTDGIKTVQSPIQVEGKEKVKPKKAPEFGEHTAELLKSLNYSDSEIADLVQAGAVGGKGLG